MEHCGSFLGLAAAVRASIFTNRVACHPVGECAGRAAPFAPILRAVRRQAVAHMVQIREGKDRHHARRVPE